MVTVTEEIYSGSSLFDSGSQLAYITPTLCVRLNLKPCGSREVFLKTFGSSQSTEKLDIVEIDLKTKNNENFFNNCLVKNDCYPISNQYVDNAKLYFKHFKYLTLANSKFTKRFTGQYFSGLRLLLAINRKQNYKSKTEQASCN